ncbi:MAG: MarR family transcriptional regulator [Agathobaculum sp.]|uniref:MarR family winged helix-turn-helix transcriptional regulator n=1 Tax=Agathobaculum sp. TaxID=2048138 RepID=UPI0025BFC48A|nr:MarR family transcriptional regulator [Agathobaculum sp.]MCI7125462.1 MarR family transcriptional regulator [Agathobaculum sp.]MDY3712648.1 MarR family transcriptional regulator [Agathobaculum sp.]
MRKRQIGAELGKLSNLLKRQMAYMQRGTEAEHITGMQAMILHHLIYWERDGDCFQKDIETHFGMRRSTATGILQLMEQHGLLWREPVARDARLKRLVLTDKARALDEKISRDLDRAERVMRQGIDEEALAVWFRVCGQLRANLEEYQSKASEGKV